MDAKLSELLGRYPELEFLASNRIHCTLTGHEMPPNYESVNSYIQGTRFQRTKRLHDQMRQNEQYFEDRGTRLFCKLTKRMVAKDGIEIEQHINGRRFKNALAKATSADENGNRMETGWMDCVDSTTPRLIDASEDSESDELIGDDIEDSTDDTGDEETADNGQLYPELVYSDNGGEGDSDYDFNAMDTDLDAETATKRKVNGHTFDSPAHKRRRC